MIRVYLHTVENGRPVIHEWTPELDESSVIQQIEMTADTQLIVSLPFHMHGGTIHTICIMDSENTRQMNL